MTLSFFGFLTRSQRASETLEIEQRSAGEAPSVAVAWAARAMRAMDRSKSEGAPQSLEGEAELLPASAYLAPAEAPKPSAGSRCWKFTSKWLYRYTIAQIGIALLGQLALPGADTMINPTDYALALQTAAQARALGFEGSAPRFGASSFSDFASNMAYKIAPKRFENSGQLYQASLRYYRVAGVSLINPRCSVTMGSNPNDALIENPEMNQKFIALHELTHCDAFARSGSSFSPSGALLPAPLARALRLILLAESGSDGQEALSEALMDSQADGKWLGHSKELFDETAADARALLALSRLEPERWRKAGWELWLNRAFGQVGSGMRTRHNHATEDAAALILSATPSELAQLSGAGLSALAGSVASDALVIKLARQGWQEHFSSERMPLAVANAIEAALQESEDDPSRAISWSQGGLKSFGVSKQAARADLAWARSDDGAAAFQFLFLAMSQMRQSAQQKTSLPHLIEGRLISTVAQPNMGDFDLRYEGDLTRSTRVWLLGAAMGIARAEELGGADGFDAKQLSGPIWKGARLFRQQNAFLATQASRAEWVGAAAEEPVTLSFLRVGENALMPVAGRASVDEYAIPALLGLRERLNKETRDKKTRASAAPKPAG